MATSVSEVKSSTTSGGSDSYPAIPKIKIKFEGYSPDSKERVKRPKIVRTEVKQPAVSVGPGSKGQCLTCHQCRQSVYSNKGTLELKVDVKSGKQRLKCSKCTRYWCERCLINRYGVILSSMDPLSWQCPFCKKKCNCSVCRKKEGKLATGIMTHIAKNAGYQSVSDFLDKGVDDVAKILQWKSPTAPKLKARSPVEVKERIKRSPDSNDKPVAELRVCFKRPNLEQQHTSPVPTKITVMPPRSAGHTLPGRTGSFVPLKVSCVENSCIVGHSSPSKWTQLDHPSYDIFIQERDPFLAQIDQNRNTAGWIRKETVVIDPHSEFTDSTAPFQASPLPFSYFTSSRSPTPVRPMRERKNPGWYSSREYDLDPQETESTSSDDNRGDISSYPPIYRFQSTDAALRLSSSPDSFCVPPQTWQGMSRLKPCRSLSDVNVGYGMADGSVDAAAMDVDCGDGQAGAMDFQHVGGGNVEHLQKQLACTLKEQLKVARQIILKAQKEIMHRGQGKPQEKGGDVNQVGYRPKEPPLADDSPEACKLASIPSLPTLPPFHLSLPAPLISPFLLVSEFLFTFQEQLGLRRRISGEDLCSVLAGGRGLAEVYRNLLSLVVIESSDLWKELKVSSRQRDLEKVAKKYLRESGRNGFLPALEVHQSMDESLVILSHLCHKVLEMGSLDEALEESRAHMDQLQREHRIKERDKGREAKEDLLRMYEKESMSEETESKRKEYVSQLEELKRENRLELYSSCLQLRNEPLGRDRHDRVYWNIQSLSAIVVECNPKQQEDCCSVHDVCVNGGHSGEQTPSPKASCEDEDENDDDEEENMEDDSSLRIDYTEDCTWSVITSNRLLEQLINCLHSQGRREKKLKESLMLLIGSLGAS